MLRRLSLLCAITSCLVGAIVLLSPSARADSPLTHLHKIYPHKGKQCFDGHYHRGFAVAGSKKEAMKRAVKNWSGFTALEYGRKWGHWRLAYDKKISCKGTGRGWSCSLKAVPCRR